jgi:glycosyltransferase involved in cell wall biosynthesis
MSCFFQEPVLSKTWSLGTHKNEIELSIIIPVFNQQIIITDVIKSLLSSITLKSELIIIDDGSEDETFASILNYFDNCNLIEFPNLTEVHLFSLRYSRFETYCDDFAIRISQARYCLEVQADMFIQDPGFDKRLVTLMQNFPDIAMLSGRGVEPLSSIIDSYQTSLGSESAFFSSEFQFILHRSRLWIKNKVKNKLHRVLNKKYDVNWDKFENTQNFEIQGDQLFLETGCAGRLGNLINLSPSVGDILPPRVYLGETVMRGPLLIDRKKYLELGGLNTDQFFLGFDDHDFCRRTTDFHYRVGYSPVNFSSPLHLGATRKHRTALSELLILVNILRIRKHRLKSPFWTAGQGKKFDHFPPEIRYLA